MADARLRAAREDRAHAGGLIAGLLAGLVAGFDADLIAGRSASR